MAKSTDFQHTEELIPAYVLGSLEPEEALSVVKHLGECPDCRRKCAEYREVVEALPHALPPESPPPALKERLLAQLAAPDRQEEAFSTPSAALPERETPAGRRKASALYRRLRVAVAVLGIAIIMGLTTSNLLLWNDLKRQQREGLVRLAYLREQWDMMTLIVSPGVHSVDLAGTPAAALARGKLFFDPNASMAAMVVTDLPSPPPGQVYQLWLIRNGGRTNGGIFRVGSAGRGYLLIKAPQNLGSYRAVGVTNEPTGGSPGPTGTKVLGGDL